MFRRRTRLSHSKYSLSHTPDQGCFRPLRTFQQIDKRSLQGFHLDGPSGPARTPNSKSSASRLLFPTTDERGAKNSEFLRLRSSRRLLLHMCLASVLLRYLLTLAKAPPTSRMMNRWCAQAPATLTRTSPPSQAVPSSPFTGCVINSTRAVWANFITSQMRPDRRH